jgi:xylose isomerase
MISKQPKPQPRYITGWHNVLVEWPRRVALHAIRVTAADALDAAGLKNEAEKLRALKDDCDMSAAYAAADAAARAAARAAASAAARADARKKINNLYNSWLEEMLLEMLEGVSNDAI